MAPFFILPLLYYIINQRLEEKIREKKSGGVFNLLLADQANSHAPPDFYDRP